MELIFFVAIIIAISSIMIKWMKSYRAKMNALPDNEDPQDLVKKESYGKYPLWISEQERQEWDLLSRKEKRIRMQLIEKGIKQGRFVLYTDENGFTGIISKKEAKEKSII